MSNATRKLETVWAIGTYDVWGNSRDGFDVNQTYTSGETIQYCPIQTANKGHKMEFDYAELTDKQIRAIFGVRCQIDVDGDDTTYYVNRRRDGYPIGELHCISHESLSPIRAK